MKEDNFKENIMFGFKLGLTLSMIIVVILIYFYQTRPKIVNTEYFSDISATVEGVIHRGKVNDAIIVSTIYGHYDLSNEGYVKKYENQKGKQVTAYLGKKTYDNGDTSLWVLDIEDN